MFIKAMMISEKDHEEAYGDKNVAKEMKHNQLVQKLYCGLETLDMGEGMHQLSTTWKRKEIEILPDPEWPMII